MRALGAGIATLVWLSAAGAAAQEADLRVAGSTIFGLDGAVRVTAAVTNDGPDDVLDVDVTAQFDTATATASELEAGCSGSSIGVVCAYSSLDTPVLAAGEELVVEFLITPEDGAGDVVLSARSTVTDPDESNNSASVALVPQTTVDIGLDERGIDAGRRKTLLFTATNDGPDTAANVMVSGSVTVNFPSAIDRDSASALTGMEAGADAVCGRQVPDSDGSFDRWTFPVLCSLTDLDVGDEVEFRFWFDGGTNAQFRVSASSGNFDPNPANDVTDGDFLNSPIEFVDVGADDDGCCATSGARRTSGWVLAVVALFVAFRRAR